MTVKAPFSAPACPPDTGASTTTEFGGFRVKLAHGRCGGVIDKVAFRCPRTHRGAQRDRTEVIVVADAGHDEILAFRGGAAASRRSPPNFRPMPWLWLRVRLATTVTS
jgi:hypothetical protein